MKKMFLMIMQTKMISLSFYMKYTGLKTNIYDKWSALFILPLDKGCFCQTTVVQTLLKKTLIGGALLISVNIIRKLWLIMNNTIRKHAIGSQY